MNTKRAFGLGVLVGAILGIIGTILAVIVFEDRS